MAITHVTFNWDNGVDTDYHGSQFGDNAFSDFPLAGDLLVIAEVWTTLPTDPTLTLAPPAGWNMVATSMNTNAGAAIFYKIADGSEFNVTYFPTYAAQLPGSLFLSSVFRGDTGLQVVTTSVTSVTNQGLVSGSVSGSGAGNQLVLAAACDSGLFPASPPFYQPAFPKIASGSITSSTFTAIPTEPSGYQEIDNTWFAPPSPTGIGLAGAFYSLQNSGLSPTVFAVSPFNRDGSDFSQVRPWAVAMLTVMEPAASARRLASVSWG